MSNTKQFSIAKINDLKDGEMKQVNADGTDILLAKIDGKYYAVGAFCTHYGAPLAEGALCGKHVICPWHHAWFDLTNGDLLQPPAFDSLPNYPLKIDNENIFVELPDKRSDRRVPEMSSCSKDIDIRVFVILGGGAVGFMAAQTLREEGYCGRIIMITQESEAPYDRPNLSKDYLQGEAKPEWMPLRENDFYKKHDIELLTGKKATRVDHQNKKIEFETGDALTYDSLLVATGGIPRKLDLPGSDLKNIFVLRSFDSADAIIDTVENVKKVVIIGGSFIGMEAAASLRGRGLSVTVVASDKVPFAKTLGPEIGEYFQNLHEKNGVKFKMGVHVKSFEGDSKVKTVILDSGEQVEADVVIAGIGVTPATDILKDVEKKKDGGVVTNSYFQLASGLYAAGDIAYVPDSRSKEHLRIEHWRYAMQQGRVAARNMAGKKESFAEVPFFWTVHFGDALRYLGHVKEWDEIYYDGNVKDGKFFAFYIKDNRVMAVADMGRDTEMAYIEQFLKDDKLPSASELKKKDLKKLIESLSKS
ncbi:pyridine nucleotide-disulfide oxidoreductase [Aequorivita sp. H23M31]|uniref:Pyridine nucleotide-disulfide oxidoreductase n=1 Tax=Aequorivita ciconiae TaxID=2494375 RepID=A0A410G0D5_9FLAO|nr:apoptosis inducing factor family protein [Aequorivita sp. H23M31]QAA80737.1 pyridine nucleotide-disulfide oxidoreductase [Aequorivita sp. H23M31]